MLRSWTPVTTSSLQRESSLAFDVLDHVLETGPYEQLQTELLPWLSQLRPARTQGDVRADEILSLVQMNVTPSRGDKSVFISREDRNAPEFATRFQHFSHLIDAIQNTAESQLKHCLSLDRSLTSVQLAVYPGDGKSGYPKHCDRSKQDGCSQRIITAVYYLTPQDWAFQDDGGCLRVFLENDEYYDVIPYSNRMIVFRSEIVEHQVLPSLRRDRMALTVWLYGYTTNSPTRPGIQSQLRENITPLSNNSLPPPLIVSENGQNDATIFVSIASYRDSELVPTLRSLMATAQYPKRVHVGVVLQVDEEADKNILKSLPKQESWFEERIKVLRMDARHARGPCYARDLCQRLYAEEDYVLQIDSHMRFRQNWDTFLIQQLKRCPSKTSMLTTYPVGYQLPNLIPTETRGTLLVPWKFDDNGMLRQRARLVRNANDNIPCHLYAAGFNFSHGRVISDCPYDAGLQHLFFGEEISMAIRLFTHGYELFAPMETVCYHLWSRAHRPAQERQDVSPDMCRRHRHASHNVVLQQLRGNGRGLGTGRTVSEFAVALGVDFEMESIQPHARLGGLQEDDFVDNATASYAPDSLEKQVASLDPKAQAMIASFLGALSS